MIDPQFCRIMARYNMWQNSNLTEAAGTLDEEALKQDLGAFFGSIHGTLNHVLWGDTMWMSRFDGWTPPEISNAESPALTGSWESYLSARAIADTRILDWALRLNVGDLGGQLTWYSGSRKAEMTKPLWLCIQHVFNHQTHHRGQVHAMLTAAGVRPGVTDLAMMPDLE